MRQQVSPKQETGKKVVCSYRKYKNSVKTTVPDCPQKNHSGLNSLPSVSQPWTLLFPSAWRDSHWLLLQQLKAAVKVIFIGLSAWKLGIRGIWLSLFGIFTPWVLSSLLLLWDWGQLSQLLSLWCFFQSVSLSSASHYCCQLWAWGLMLERLRKEQGHGSLRLMLGCPLLGLGFGTETTSLVFGAVW